MLGTLRERFGYGGFRDGQEQVVKALLDGRSALAVFPTGGGKSLCYQLPALLLDGLTVVVSPLIALMKDQVDSLVVRGIPAARLDSSLDAADQKSVLDGLERGAFKLLYVAPERLANPRFLKLLKRLDLSLAAIDEAHCISEWGHNFRPDYLRLAKTLRSLKVSRVLALTATATPKVAADIRKRFRIAKEDQVQLSFHRPNLDLRIVPCEVTERKAKLVELLENSDGAAVVYVTRQETAEEVATFLAKQGFAARAYHAGLHDDFRTDAQRAFMSGEARVVVATIAFGMGIDKADIRSVIHYNLPKSMENYTQEIGRAGRDGKPAACTMLACGADLTVLENFVHSDTPTPKAIGNLIDRLLRVGGRFTVSPYDLSVTCDIRSSVVATVITYLELDGILESEGMFYAIWQIRPLAPVARLLAGRPAAEKKLINRLMAEAEGRRSWLKFDVEELERELGISKEKLMALLGDLERAGDVALKVSGVRQAYRLKKDPGPLDQLALRLADAFAEREKTDLKRISGVLSLSARRGCLTAGLVEYFGESFTGACGHCDRCRGIPPKVIRRPKPRRISDGELAVIAGVVEERQPALSTPRQLARFLCGMTSPAAMRARLYRHEACGLLADVPFTEVLVIAEATIC